MVPHLSLPSTCSALGIKTHTEVIFLIKTIKSGIPSPIKNLWNGTCSHYYCPDIQHMAFNYRISMFLFRSPGMLCHANWTTVTMKQCAASIENSGTGKYWYITDMDDCLTIICQWEWSWYTMLCYAMLTPLVDGTQRAHQLRPRCIGTVRSWTQLQINQSIKSHWLTYLTLLHLYNMPNYYCGMCTSLRLKDPENASQWHW